MYYTTVIKTALIVFPFIAFLFTLSYMLKQYHKYGSVQPLRTVIVYSFILYLITAYFLVILPLPTREYVASLTSPRVRFEFFGFIKDFITQSEIVLTDYHTYISAIKKACFYVPVFNIFLTMPFGIYLRYYFKFDFKKTIIASFLLSLFFELTQLSGLYFIYPRSYRLFDIDDLFLNTLGGVLGFYIGYLFMKFLPSREKIDNMSYDAGKKVSFIKRITSYIFDFIVYLIVSGLISFFTGKSLFLTSLLFYYVILPRLLNDQTLGQKFLNMKMESNDDKKLSIWRLLIRFIGAMLTYIIIPITIIFISCVIYPIIDIETKIKMIGLIIVFIVIFIYYLVLLIKMIRRKSFLYELVSHSKISSTINDEVIKKKKNKTR